MLTVLFSLCDFCYNREPTRRKGLFANLPPRKNFIQAKLDFIDEMLRFGRMHPDQLQEQREKEQQQQAQQTEENLSESDATASQPAPPLKILDVGCGIGGTSR